MSEENTQAAEPAIDSGGWDDEPAQKGSDGWDDEPSESSQDDKPKPSSTSAKPKLDDDEEEEGEAKAKSEEEDKPKPKTKKKYVRVGNEMLEEGELSKMIEKAKGADKLFREAAEMRKSSAAQVKKFFQAFLENPQAILSHPKLNIPVEKRKEIGERLLGQALEYEFQDPKDRELAEYKQREKMREEQEARQREEQEQQEFREKTETRKREISETLAKAMEMTPLSKDPITASSTLREMALYLRAARQNGENPSPEDIANHVADKRHREYYALANTLSGEELVSFLGDDVVKKISQYQIEKLREKRGQSFGQRQAQNLGSWTNKPKKGKRSKIDPMGARERIRQQLGLE